MSKEDHFYTDFVCTETLAKRVTKLEKELAQKVKISACLMEEMMNDLEKRTCQSVNSLIDRTDLILENSKELFKRTDWSKEQLHKIAERCNGFIDDNNILRKESLIVNEALQEFAARLNNIESGLRILTDAKAINCVIAGVKGKEDDEPCH